MNDFTLQNMLEFASILNSTSFQEKICLVNDRSLFFKKYFEVLVSKNFHNEQVDTIIATHSNDVINGLLKINTDFDFPLAKRYKNLFFRITNNILFDLLRKDLIMIEYISAIKKLVILKNIKGYFDGSTVEVLEFDFCEYINHLCYKYFFWRDVFLKNLQ